MYSYIQGKIVDKTFTSIVVDNNGIGYEIGVSGNTLTDIDMGEIVKIYTYLYVREDEMSLYGFSRLEEKKTVLAPYRNQRYRSENGNANPRRLRPQNTHRGNRKRRQQNALQNQGVREKDGGTHHTELARSSCRRHHAFQRSSGRGYGRGYCRRRICPRKPRNFKNRSRAHGNRSKQDVPRHRGDYTHLLAKNEQIALFGE